MFNKGQLAGLMKQAQAMQEQMQSKMAKIEEDLAGIEVEGQSGAGLVKVTMTGKMTVKRIAIDPSLLADDKDMLEDLVAAGVNDAVRKAEKVAEEKRASVSAGMQLPPGMKMPFRGCGWRARGGAAKRAAKKRFTWQKIQCTVLNNSSLGACHASHSQLFHQPCHRSCPR